MNVNEIMGAARARTQLRDLGDDAILEGLGVLVEALDREAGLSERGKGNVEAMLVNMLSGRLRVENYLAQRPDLLDQPIEAPTFVFGLPRTGTTLLINLLNEDPTRRCLMRFEALDPVPPPRTGQIRSDPRYLAEQARLEAALQHAPHIAAMHYEEADGPTECQFAMAPSFCAQLFDSQFHIPSYLDWLLQTSYLPAFRYHKRLLQMLQSEASGRWTLKNPWHPLFLDDLTTVYPDARLVMTHRDPAEVVASACSLVEAVRVMFSDRVDPQAVAHGLLRTFDAMIARSAVYREKHGPDAIHDVGYKALVADPIGEVRKVYAHLGLPLEQDAEGAMRAYLASNPKGKHGRHDYLLGHFGLTRDGVRERFAGYIAQFDL